MSAVCFRHEDASEQQWRKTEKRQKEKERESMKFLHVSDLHIGKIVNDFSMLEDQKFILDQITKLAAENAVDALIIAGDVYDRAIPPAEAVAVFDRFLTELAALGISVFMISGNHDSPERIGFGEELLEKSRLYISGSIKEELKVISIPEEGTELQIVLMPFVKPAQVGVRTTQEAVEKLLSAYWEKEKRKPDRKVRRILVTHYFVTDAGWQPELSDAETTVHVGGLDNVEASVLEGFDYVALGHIHKYQRIGMRPVWYCGAPLKYSFGESQQEKRVILFTMEAEGLKEVRDLPLSPMRRMCRLKGNLKDLMEKEEFAGTYREDYIQAILTDRGEIIDPIGTLRSVYPNIMQIVREEVLKSGTEEQTEVFGRRLLAEKKDTKALFAAFYREVKGEELGKEKEALITELIKEIEV